MPRSGPRKVSPYSDDQIDLPYTVNYWVSVNNVAFGPSTYDPEVDISPGSGDPLPEAG